MAVTMHGHLNITDEELRETSTFRLARPGLRARVYTRRDVTRDFIAGPATAVGTAVIRERSEVVSTQTWMREVQLAFP